MINYWDKIMDELIHKSESLGDLHMIAIINKLILIPSDIKKYVLKEFLK